MVLAACAPIQYQLAKANNVHLLRARQLLAQGDTEGALQENRKVIEHHPHSPPGDEALYNLGSITLQHAKTKEEIQKAVGFFARLEKDFPKSPRSREVAMWSSIFENPQKTKQIAFELEARKNVLPGQPDEMHLVRAQQFLAQKKFADALREEQEVVARNPENPPGDEALFNMGLIEIHYANPQKDIGKALAFFTRLVKEFPKSRHIEEAKTWICILQTMEKSRQIDNEIEAKKREMGR
jgi:TolA-binding protein